ncbi:hypothetical protein [Simplicispira suum]|uniref:Uncharacterized protein n=1 Tax=Simplicispira suum TaxID=2109915 RepID=A0A2S0N5M7_9BURK|nr:hypothetical protein [Simplicispira suum]AVO43454.1 hypothetical protein C6571_18690 [Simplicispira suum]
MANSGSEYDFYRVWPDGTLQAVGDGAPYSWMSDDFVLISAADEESARELASVRAIISQRVSLQP